MANDVIEAALKEIVHRNLSKVAAFKPYKKFPGVSSREHFADVLRNDPALAPFGLHNDKYIVARVGGNWITSLHRKLGDAYQEMFTYLISQRYDLKAADVLFSVDVQIGSRIQRRSTDGVLRLEHLARRGMKVADLIASDRMTIGDPVGLGFEVRSCYQIGDSKRIQADYDMALALVEEKLIPVMLVFCKTSLRSPTNRLAKSWVLMQGEEAFAFVHKLTDFDLRRFLQENSEELAAPVSAALSKI